VKKGADQKTSRKNEMVPTRKPQARKKQIRKLQAKEMVPTRKPQANKQASK
jgi:hypothetical protein